MHALLTNEYMLALRYITLQNCLYLYGLLGVAKFPDSMFQEEQDVSQDEPESQDPDQQLEALPQ